MELVLRKSNTEEFELWSGVIEDKTDLNIVADKILGAFKVAYELENSLDIIPTVWIDDNEIVDGQINGAYSLKAYLEDLNNEY